MGRSPALMAGADAASERVGDLGVSSGGMRAPKPIVIGQVFNIAPKLPSAAWMGGGGRRYCCRCLTDKPLKGGRHRGPLFTCADCRSVLEKPE
jgi:hypothetical protein